MSNYKRSGDHYFLPIDKLPKNLKKVELESNKFIFGVGKASNHNHVITSPRLGDMIIYEDNKGERFFEIKIKSEITHVEGNSTKTAEHKKIFIQPGIYKQNPEREIDLFSQVVRRVVD